MSDEKRRKRREIRALQREATWLQKVLFGLGKAQEAREKFGDARGKEVESIVLELEDGPVPIETIEDALESRIQELLEVVRERRRNLR
ncbi:MAG: hypothetical protein EA351_04505 [Gemmatimonadales bacterium]|nr:MAG: hypothetical protein EA351_04505 [Gemmatimonadales bacterium]